MCHVFVREHAVDAMGSSLHLLPFLLSRARGGCYGVTVVCTMFPFRAGAGEGCYGVIIAYALFSYCSEYALDAVRS